MTFFITLVHFFFLVLLQEYIDNIRETYTRHFKAKDETKRQIAVATYLIDRLALRAGNEKVICKGYL